MMKVIGVISSMNKNGNSATLVRKALAGAGASGAETAEIYLPDYHLEYCTGCSRCMSTGRCFQSDDFEKLRAALYTADGLIFGAPTYCGAPDARMKTFFDRLGLYEVFSANLSGKHVAAISSASFPGDARKTARTMARLLTGWVFSRGYATGCLGVKARPQGAVQDGDLRRAEALGKKLAAEIASGKRHPWQNLPRRLIDRLVLRPAFRKAILANKDGALRGVYASLSQRGLI